MMRCRTGAKNGRKLRISIKTKIWLAIMGIVVAVILAIWVLQVMFFEDYYVRIKKRELAGVVDSITQIVDEQGLGGSMEELIPVVTENRLCISIAPDMGYDHFTLESMPYDCYVHREKGREAVLFHAARSGGRGRQILEVHDTVTKQDYLIGLSGGEIGGKAAGAYAVIVTQTLAPVREAAFLVKNQLMYVSIVLIVVATLVAFFVSRSLTKPLLKLSGAVREIAGGKLNVSVDVSSGDEIGALGENVNYMSKEISKVNTLQKELVANISHDMRTPLTMIRGYAEMIKDITGEDKQMREQQLDIIMDEANRLSTLVSDVMDLSLMQAGQSPLNLGTFDVSVKARDILGRYQLLEQTSGFSFCLAGEENCFVTADEVRIEQVLYNLINNAVNHIGEVKRITVAVEKEAQGVRVSVTDTGTGIPQEDLPLIWDRYFKLYKKTEQKQMGTGLGLSIVKAILVNHHARFGVTSTLGKGSTFWFILESAEPEQKNRE